MRLSTAFSRALQQTVRQQIRRTEQRLRRRLRVLAPLKRAVRDQKRMIAALERKLERVRAAGGVRSATTHATEIRALRTRLQLSRANFAKRIGVSSGAVYLWETGRASPTARSLAKLRRLRPAGATSPRRRGRPRR